MPLSRDKCALAVDDDPAFLSVMKLCLRTCGFNKACTATDATSALELLEQTAFDLIVSDWNMLPADGLELLRAVKKNRFTSRIPFIFMSADLSEQAWREAVGLGVTEFLVKPFSLSALRRACIAASAAAENENSAAMSTDDLRLEAKSKLEFKTRV